MQIKLVNEFKLLSEDECKGLLNGLPDASLIPEGFHSYAIEKAIDSYLFDMAMTAAKNNNRMKIAISAIPFLNICVHGKVGKYVDSMYWSPEDTDKKMRFFLPVLNEIGIELSVSVGSIKETFVPKAGFGYTWPSWAALNTVSDSNFGLVNLDATIIGKKLS